MAERRMLSIKITSSARFLRMSHASQALYMHLVMNADDDGVVEAFSVMRLAAATEENLQELADRKFIRLLNEDLVAHILDWDENNKIRSDRKRDSIYKDLLEQVETEEENAAVAVVEAAAEPDAEESSNDAPAANRGQVAADCGQLPANRGQVAADCPHRIGKVRLGEDRVGTTRDLDSISKDRDIDTHLCAEAPSAPVSAPALSLVKNSQEDTAAQPNQGGGIRSPAVPYAAIMDEYNAICVSLTPIKVMSEKRKKEAKTRFLREFRGDMGEVRAFFRKVEASDFLCGRNGHGWTASFDWLMKSANAIKVLEGTYDNKRPRAPDIERIPQVDVAARAIAILEAEHHDERG
ncbi:hypothetical protein QCO44_09300 [Selenomonas sputigena]|uniref:Uncharacterized protein n=1 Tax=Selenomonas sputigena TaxID=69823 RepID=A0ABV3X6K2_9FIRM